MRSIQREIVGAFIFSNDGYLLIGKNAKGGVYDEVWVIPGGGIEADESMLDALKREILEEVGIDISNAEINKIDLPLTGEAPKTLKETGERVLMQMTFNNYKVNLDDPAESINIRLEDDLREARWCKLDELNSLTFSPSVTKVLEHLGCLSQSA